MNNLVLDNTETGGLSDGAIGEADVDSFLSHSLEPGSWDSVAEPQLATANANPLVGAGGISRGLSVILFGYSIRAVVLMLAFMIIGLMVSSFVLNF